MVSEIAGDDNTSEMTKHLIGMGAIEGLSGK